MDVGGALLEVSLIVKGFPFMEIILKLLCSIMASALLCGEPDAAAKNVLF
jgi:hypothetical protein